MKNLLILLALLISLSNAQAPVDSRTCYEVTFEYLSDKPQFEYAACYKDMPETDNEVIELNGYYIELITDYAVWQLSQAD